MYNNGREAGISIGDGFIQIGDWNDEFMDTIDDLKDYMGRDYKRWIPKLVYDGVLSEDEGDDLFYFIKTRNKMGHGMARSIKITKRMYKDLKYICNKIYSSV